MKENTVVDRVQQRHDGELSVSKSIVALDGETSLVVVSLTTTDETPVHVRSTEALPATHSLTFSQSERDFTDGDGVLVLEALVEPDEPVTFGYRLTGPADPELPEPQVERLTETAPDANIRAEWRGTDGETTPLAVAPNETTPQEMRAVPVVTLPGESEGRPAEAILSENEPRIGNVAIGVVLTPSNEDAAYRTVLRAMRLGHDVFATYTGMDEDAEAVHTLSLLGATVVSPPLDATAQTVLHRTLSGTARGRGYSGIVLQTRECPRIDYERTVAAVKTADYEVIAIPEQWEQSSDSPTIVVGIPAYNAAGSIGEVVERAAAYADEVLVVDDGSRDGTADEACEAGASVVVHERNRGYGGALKTLFRESADRDATHLVVIDADGQHDPADIPLLVETQRQDDADIVIGSRYVGERKTKIPLVRSLGLFVINSLTNYSLGKLRPSGFIRDTQSGYRVYNRSAIRSLAADPSIGNNMGASTDILYHAHRQRFTVAEVATTISYDVENASTQGSFSHGLDLVRNIFWTVEYGRPLLIVGLPGFLLMLLGVSGSVLLFAQYAETGSVAALPFTAAVLAAVGGAVLCVTALVMHVFNSHPIMKRLGTDANN